MRRFDQATSGRCRIPIIRIAGGGMALMVASGGNASAQILDQYFPPVSFGEEAFSLDTVLSHNRSAFDNKGIRYDGLVIRPDLIESFGFDDNILGSPTRLASAEARTQVGISAATDRSRDSLVAGVTADNVDFLSQPAQSFTNWTASLGGSRDIWRGKATLTYSHMALNLQPSAIDNLKSGVPVPYVVDDVHAAYSVDLGRFSVQPEFGFTQYRFDTVVVDGLNQGSEAGNREVGSGALTVAYEFDTSRKIVVALRGSYSAFANANGSPLRNNTGLTALTGVDYTANGLVRYRVLVGYAERLYDSRAYQTITAPVAEGSVIWTPRRVTTVTATISRRIEDAVDASEVGYTYTQADLSVDHEVRRDVLLRFHGSAQIADYTQNVGTQTIYTAGVRVEWYLNRVASLTGDYTGSLGRNPQSIAENSALRGSYRRDVVLFGLHLKL